MLGAPAIGDAADGRAVVAGDGGGPRRRPVGGEARRQLNIQRLMAECGVDQPAFIGIARAAPVDIVADQRQPRRSRRLWRPAQSFEPSANTSMSFPNGSPF